jgi:hypothetical protein
MSVTRFVKLFPELAAKERRSVILPEDVLKDGKVFLPADEYAFDEAYCTEPGCNCRRVVLNVFARRGKAYVATISHSFEPPERGALISRQTFLDPLETQSKWSGAVLDLFVNSVLRDAAYRQRLVRHYRMAKDAGGDLVDASERVSGWPQVEQGAVSSVRRSPIPPPPRRGKRKWR